MQHDPSKESLLITPVEVPMARRKFLTYSGLSAGALIFAASCSKQGLWDPSLASASHSLGGGKDGGKTVVNLGSGDIGILNYAYALEQLEAAFYIRALETPYAGISDKEMEYLSDVRDHEIAHREWFKKVLGNNRIGGLIMNFSSINFNSRESVLGTAKSLEDVGVSAYNGAGELLQSATYLLFAGKIVSVEARHSAAIRDMLNYGSFADSTAVNAMGLDLYRTPPDVLAIASGFITTTIISKNLPTS